MRDGKLLQIAAPGEIYNRPADLFVASFTGASNLLAGRVVDRQGEFGTIEAASGHRLTAWLPLGVAAGARVKIAVRPENVQCGAQGSGPNQFTARVLAQRYEGAQTFYDLAVLGGQLAVLELGTSARHPVDSDVEITLPPALCWAYPDV
jgi:iron(III) transport system ATP-binding protein